MEVKYSKELIKDCINKVLKLSDDSWEDLIKKYSLNISCYHLRKMSYGMKIAYDSFISESSEEDKLLEIKKQKIQLNDLRTQTNKEIRKLSRTENIIELLKQDINNIDSFPNINNKIEIFENGDISILLISDIHYDGNLDIIKRVNKLIDKTIEKCNFHKINQLFVIFNGDLINNEFKTTVRLESRENISNQIIGVSKLISDVLYKLCQNIPYVFYSILSGNHERSITDYKQSLSTDSFLPIIDEIVDVRVNKVNNLIKIKKYEEDKRFCILNIKDKTYVATHGDAIKNVENKGIETVEGYLNISIDYLLLGHFHNPKSFMKYNKSIIINGALTDENDYSKKLLLKTPSVQKLMMIDKNGDIECTYDIKLKD